MPALATVVVLSLGAGIGVNTVVFSWMDARVLRPIPGIASGRSFHLIEPRTEAGLYPGASWPEYRDLRERLASFQSVIAFRTAPLYVGESGSVERVFGLLVSDNYFAALGVRPVLGRFLRPDEVVRPGGEPVAVISYGLWRSRFDGSADALGRTVRVNARDLTIVGVTPQEFQGTVQGLNFDIWVPATLAPVIANGSRELETRAARAYAVIGQLRPGRTREQAQAELGSVMRQLAEAHPDTNAAIGGQVLPFWQSPRGPQRLLTSALAMLQGIMLLLLLAVCGNTATLVLARASARQKEIGIHLALGARPRDILRLILTENVALAIAGAAVGTALAVWGTQALMVLPLTGFPLRFQTSIGLPALAFAMLLGLASGLLFGAAPALQLARLDPLRALRSGARHAGRSNVRSALMAIQVALALLVLIVAGLFFRSVLEARDTDPGFRREGILLAAYHLAGRTSDRAFTRTLAGRLLERVRGVPGIEAAAIASSVPLDIHGLPARIFTLDGRARSDGRFDEALSNIVTPDYFAVLDIPLRSGSTFADLRDATAPPQAIVNEEFVRRYFGGAEAIGRWLEARGGRYVIAGVVRNSLYNAFGEPPTPIIYFSYRDSPQPRGELHLRTRGTTATALAPELRRAVREVDPELPLFNVRSLDDHVETNLVFRRVPARMFAVLGPLLLTLAAIGIYAVVAYTVSLRTTEIGVRLAVGATRGRIVREFVGQTLAVVSTGAIAGWALAFAGATAFMPNGRIDGAVFVGVPLLLLLVAAFACWLPARRATRVDPVMALRGE
jgi:predicted permease